MSRTFLLHMRSTQDRMKIYEDEVLLGMARSLIPIEKFEAAASGEDQQGQILLELLSWFKSEFFRWFNPPKCRKCPDDQQTESCGMLEPTREDQFYGAARVEGYKCPKCLEIHRFPRYNHPEKLLQTRVGRCGEWANCFALCCRAMGFDTRWVEDNADHVWTEIYSLKQQRWLHCDPCENTCDKPLMYEAGWGKTYAYVMAFSVNEIADVTWRYTADHKVVMTRRTRVSEAELARWIIEENRRIQSRLPLERRIQLRNRFVAELVEFLSPRKQLKEGETEGRASGPVEWRKARGELGNTPKEFGVVLVPNDYEAHHKKLALSYSMATDKYHRLNTDSELAESMTGWKSAVFSCSKIFRKVETDWQMAYLARIEKSIEGEIEWKIQSGNNQLRIKRIRLKLITKVYNSGNVVVTICSGDGHLCCRYKTDDTEQIFDEFEGTTEVSIKVKLSGGSGDVAWQQSQLFRTSMRDQQEKQFCLTIEFT